MIRMSGIGHQAAGDRHHLLLAAGERAGGLAPPLGEPRKQGEHLVEAVGIFGRRAFGEGAELEILGDRHGAEQLPALRHQRKAARRLDVGRQPRHVLALEQHAAAPGRDGAGDRAQRRGLAGAVGADDRGELAAARPSSETPHSTCTSP